MNRQNADLNSFRNAYQKDFPYYSEDVLMLEWYASRTVKLLRERKAKSVISLGIGRQVVSKTFLDFAAKELDSYTIVEGSSEIIKEFKQSIALPKNCDVVHSYFESYKPEQNVDAIEMGFVLEHVDDPLSLLTLFSQFVSPSGRIFLAVPNATSLHRQVGYEAGLMEDMYQLSQADKELGHQRYFDVTSLTTLVQGAGCQICRIEGIFLKPLTTAQLKSLNLSERVYQALCKIGIGFPDLCNAIFMEIERPNTE